MGLGRGELLGVNEERRGHGGWGEEWRGEGADDGGDIIWGEADGGGEMVVVAEVAVGGVEADPAGAREVDFGPGVEGAFGDFLVVIKFAEVTAGESGGEAEGASGIGEEDGVIAAGTGAEGEGFGGWSGGAIFASGVGDVLVDGGVEADEGFDGGGWGGRRGPEGERDGGGDVEEGGEDRGFGGGVGEGEEGGVGVEEEAEGIEWGDLEIDEERDGEGGGFFGIKDGSDLVIEEVVAVVEIGEGVGLEEEGGDGEVAAGFGEEAEEVWGELDGLGVGELGLVGDADIH